MEYKYENGHIVPINNSVSNKRLDRLEEVVKTLNPEGGVLTKEDIEEVAAKADDALKTANATSNELSTFKTKVEGTYVKETALNNYATKEKVEEVATKAYDALQKAKEVNTNLNNFKTKVDNTYATKLSLSSYATKLSLSSYVQSSALENFATKDSLTDFATKAEIEELIETINTQLSAI